jgi:hypothetical protein
MPSKVAARLGQKSRYIDSLDKKITYRGLGDQRIAMLSMQEWHT